MGDFYVFLIIQIVPTRAKLPCYSQTQETPETANVQLLDIIVQNSCSLESVQNVFEK